MKPRPILFSGPMVRAILDGRKTQTRRVVKPQPVPFETDCVGFPDDYLSAVGEPWMPVGGVFKDRWVCPYGKPGDRLWVRETFLIDDFNFYPRGPLPSDRPKLDDDAILYLADGTCCEQLGECGCEGMGSVWRPSIHMPYWASRITLEITRVRVERLQEITEEDAKAEGIHKPAGSQFWYADPRENVLPAITPVGGFLNLWNSINGRPKLPRNTSSRRYARIKRWLERHPDKSWDANPWVWVIEFRRVEK